MKKIGLIVLCILSGWILNPVKAQLLDTSDAERFFTFGARIGFNTSNRTIPNSDVTYYNHESWGTGFNVGVVANLNFKEYISLQPGLFYESRSGNFASAAKYEDIFSADDVKYEMGHWRAYYFTIPVVAVLHLNISDNVKVNGEFGPYVQFRLKESGVGYEYFQYLPFEGGYHHYTADPATVDFGLKMGAGLQFYQHYYVGFHYLAGLCNAWKRPSGGKNKSWMFTIGYDF